MLQKNTVPEIDLLSAVVSHSSIDAAIAGESTIFWMQVWIECARTYFVCTWYWSPSLKNHTLSRYGCCLTCCFTILWFAGGKYGQCAHCAHPPSCHDWIVVVLTCQPRIHLELSWSACARRCPQSHHSIFPTSDSSARVSGPPCYVTVRMCEQIRIASLWLSICMTQTMFRLG